jgi:filamentous hemagglutinin family protein
MKVKINLLICLLAFAYGSTLAYAGVTTDGSLGAAQTLNGPNYSIAATLGQTAGNNLFHSFGQFNLQNGESANFSGPANIANVISRVTGGVASNISGQINVGIAGANLYFINPAGIVFHNGAQLNVPGATVFSTANGLRMSDGVTIGTTAADLLTSAANPSALVFSGSPAAISVLGASLTVAKGKSLSLVGGDAKLDTDPAVSGSVASLNAPGGNIAVISLAGGSSFSITLPNYNVPGTAPRGNITLANGSQIISSEIQGDTTGAGKILLVGNTINASNSEIRAETRIGNSAGVMIDAKAITLDNVKINTATIGGAGNAGPITINTGTLDLFNKTQIDSSSDPVDRTADFIPSIGTGGSGLGGDISITASGHVSMTGCITCYDPNVSDPTPNATGLFSTAFGSGKAGNINITTGQDLSLTNNTIIQSDSLGAGDAGIIHVVARNMSMNGGSQLTSSVFNTGQGGDILLALSGGLDISEQGRDIYNQIVPSGVFSVVSAAGAGGRVDISAVTVAVRQGGEISSSNLLFNASISATGKAGKININASQSVLATGQSFLDAGKARPGGIYTSSLASGDAGGLTITTPIMTVSDGAWVQSQNLEGGAGGSINLNVKQLNISGGGVVSVNTEDHNSGGDINILNADLVSLVGLGSGIFSETRKSYTGQTGDGKGGSVYLTAKSLVMSDRAAISADTLFTGLGGNITITTTDSVRLSGGASISAKSIPLLGAPYGGDAGTVSINAGATMRLLDSRLETYTENAQGGDINVTVHDLLYLQNSGIITKAKKGMGNGGNITIDPTLTVLNQSLIIADADAGNGGNIGLTTNTFLKSSNSIIRAHSNLAIDGNIVFSSPVLDLSAQILSLPNMNGEMRIDDCACAGNHKVTRSTFGVLRASGWRAAASDLLSGFMVVNPEPEVHSYNGF